MISFLVNISYQPFTDGSNPPNSYLQKKVVTIKISEMTLFKIGRELRVSFNFINILIVNVSFLA